MNWLPTSEFKILQTNNCLSLLKIFECKTLNILESKNRLIELKGWGQFKSFTSKQFLLFPFRNNFRGFKLKQL